MKLEEQIENDDLFSDSDDNSNKELNINFYINQLSNIRRKNYDSDDFNFLNSSSSSLSSSSYPSDLSNNNSSQNENNKKKNRNKKRKKGNTSLNNDKIYKQALNI